VESAQALDQVIESVVMAHRRRLSHEAAGARRSSRVP
jgi:hypothetical protein